MAKRKVITNLLYVIVVCVVALNLVLYFMNRDEDSSIDMEVVQQYYDNIYKASEQDGNELAAKHKQFEVTKFELRFTKYTQNLLVESGELSQLISNEEALDQIVKQKLIRLEAESYGIEMAEEEWATYKANFRAHLTSEQGKSEAQTQDQLKAWAKSANVTIDELIDHEHFKQYIQSSWYTMQLADYVYAEEIIEPEQYAIDNEALPAETDIGMTENAFTAYIEELYQKHKNEIEIIDINI